MSEIITGTVRRGDILGFLIQPTPGSRLERWCNEEGSSVKAWGSNPFVFEDYTQVEGKTSPFLDDYARCVVHATEPFIVYDLERRGLPALDELPLQTYTMGEALVFGPGTWLFYEQ